jgi:hypothetical protein
MASKHSKWEMEVHPGRRGAFLSGREARGEPPAGGVAGQRQTFGQTKRWRERLSTHKKTERAEGIAPNAVSRAVACPPSQRL